jgi:hypothetical protein
MTLAEGTLMNGAAEIITGRCAVWPLPHTPECARTARSKVRAAVAELLPERLDDCLEMVSELATNAWVHGLGGDVLPGDEAPAAGRSELAIYRRGPEHRAELVVTVFDPSPDLDDIPDPAPNVLAAKPDKPLNESPPPEVQDALLALLPDKPPEEPLVAVADLPPQRWSGQRGLETVRGLSDGRCGFRRTRSRLGAWRVPGKTAWFSVPIPAGSLAARPPAISLSPAEAVRMLESELAARGLDGMICSDGADRSLLSLSDVTVWCGDQCFSWRSGDQAVQLPISDFVETVEQVIALIEDRRHFFAGSRPAEWRKTASV